MHSKDPESRTLAEQALARLEDLKNARGIGYGRDPGTGDRYNIDEFVAEMRKRLRNPSAAIEEDKRILERVRKLAEPR